MQAQEFLVFGDGCKVLITQKLFSKYIITNIEKLIGIAKATIFPKNEPVERESPTIIVIPPMANTIEKKLINETFSFR